MRYLRQVFFETVANNLRNFSYSKSIVFCSWLKEFVCKDAKGGVIMPKLPSRALYNYRIKYPRTRRFNRILVFGELGHHGSLWNLNAMPTLLKMDSSYSWGRQAHWLRQYASLIQACLNRSIANAVPKAMEIRSSFILDHRGE